MTNINVDDLVNQLADQFTDSPIKTLLTDAFQSCFDKQKSDLEALIEAKASGDLTDDEFALEIEREKQILEAELLTLQISAKAEVQQLVNTVFQFISKSLL